MSLPVQSPKHPYVIPRVQESGVLPERLQSILPLEDDVFLHQHNELVGMMLSDVWCCVCRFGIFANLRGDEKYGVVEIALKRPPAASQQNGGRLRKQWISTINRALQDVDVFCRNYGPVQKFRIIVYTARIAYLPDRMSCAIGFINDKWRGIGPCHDEVVQAVVNHFLVRKEGKPVVKFSAVQMTETKAEQGMFANLFLDVEFKT